MNKKSQLGDQIMIFPFIFFLILITGGIVAGTYAFYGAGYDSRKAESQILVQKISHCFSENSINFPETTSLPNDEFYAKCKINKKVIETYFSLSISLNDAEKFRINSPEQCPLGDKNPQFPKCSDNTIETSQGKIYILAGTNQEGKKEAST